MIAGNWSCGKSRGIKMHIPSCPPPTSALFYPCHRQLSLLTWPSLSPALKSASAGGRGRGRGSEIFSSSPSLSAWNDKPYELLPNGKRAYLDELDVVAFLDPPKQLIPLDPSSYNPASYLWKKIEDIPEERRHRLLSLLTPRLISIAWEIAGTRYDDPKLVIKTSSNLLSDGSDSMRSEYWSCRTSGGPLTISWINFFKKALFYTSDRKLYGRLIGDSLLNRLFNSIWPLYFTVSQLDEVISTEQPCDLAYEFGDGMMDLNNYPEHFPEPAKHPWPFSDQVVIYVRHMGPGVMVGQAWQEGEALEQVPRKLCSEILMVKDYAASSVTDTS